MIFCTLNQKNMPKNYRKIPKNILEKLNIMSSDELIVWTVLIIKESEINDSIYSDLNFVLENWTLLFTSEFIPSVEKWRSSKKNIQWYRIKYKDKPKVSDTFYLWERPFYWDYRKWEFSLYVTKDVYPYDDIPPRELFFKASLIKEEEINGKKVYSFKIIVAQSLDKNNDNFEKDLLFNINLLQENFLKSNIFEKSSTNSEFLDTVELDWEIFPPWERDADFKKIIWKGKMNPIRLGEIKKRFDFILDCDPDNIIYWTSWLRSYFWAKFSEKLVVFENTDYWNALYILFENWEEISKLSRLEIQNRPNNEYIRIPHVGDWKNEAKRIIRNKR